VSRKYVHRARLANLEANDVKVDMNERRNKFHELAEQRYATIVATGKTIPWDQMRKYLEDRVSAIRKRNDGSNS